MKLEATETKFGSNQLNPATVGTHPCNRLLTLRLLLGHLQHHSLVTGGWQAFSFLLCGDLHRKMQYLHRNLVLNIEMTECFTNLSS